MTIESFTITRNYSWLTANSDKIEQYHSLLGIFPDEGHQQELTEYPYRIGLRFLWQTLFASPTVFQSTFTVSPSFVPDVAVSSVDFDNLSIDSAKPHLSNSPDFNDDEANARILYGSIMVWSVGDEPNRMLARISHYCRSIAYLLRATLKAPFSQGEKKVSIIRHGITAIASIPKSAMLLLQIIFMTLGICFDGVSRWFGKWLFAGIQYIQQCLGFIKKLSPYKLNKKLTVSNSLLFFLKYAVSPLLFIILSLPGLIFVGCVLPFWFVFYALKLIHYKVAVISVRVTELLEALAAIVLAIIERDKVRWTAAKSVLFQSLKSLMLETLFIVAVLLSGGLAGPVYLGGVHTLSLMLAAVNSIIPSKIISYCFTSIAVSFSWSFFTNAIKRVVSIGSKKYFQESDNDSSRDDIPSSQELHDMVDSPTYIPKLLRTPVRTSASQESNIGIDHEESFGNPKDSPSPTTPSPQPPATNYDTRRSNSALDLRRLKNPSKLRASPSTQNYLPIAKQLSRWSASHETTQQNRTETALPVSEKSSASSSDVSFTVFKPQ